jgi:hypothetical protein
LDSTDLERIRQQLAHVYWIGGSPCSGKSSIVAWLAQRHPFTTYNCDDAFGAHGTRATPEAQPALYRVTRMAWDEIWMRPPEVLLADVIAVLGEEFPMVLDDLLALPGKSPVVAEGAALMPSLVHDLLLDPGCAIWIVPSEGFQRAVYPKRGAWVEDILDQCTEPEQAFQNWMDRDASFARRVKEEARARGLAVIEADGQRTIEQMARLVEVHYTRCQGARERG